MRVPPDRPFQRSKSTGPFTGPADAGRQGNLTLIAGWFWQSREGINWDAESGELLVQTREPLH